MESLNNGNDEVNIDDLIEESFDELCQHIQEGIDTYDDQALQDIESSQPIALLTILDNVIAAYSEGTDSTAYEVAHRSFFFAVSVAEVLPGPVAIDGVDYFEEDPEILLAKLSYHGLDYQLDHPWVSAIITKFISTIDPSSKYHTMIEHFVTVLLIKMESHTQKEYIKQVLGELSTQFINEQD